jgi:hypothetical protein
MYSFMQTVEEARHVGLDKKDLLMEVRRLGADLVPTHTLQAKAAQRRRTPQSIL